jgi:LPS O-antigen subunit length determinant protein (WzzB/FepE family)
MEKCERHKGEFMNNESQDNEISLIDLAAVLWHKKVMIIVITLIAALGVVLFSVASLLLPPEISPLPNLYTAKATALINNGISSEGTGSSNRQLAQIHINSNTLLDKLINEFDLITYYKIQKSIRSESRKILTDKLKVKLDIDSGILNVSFTDTNPEFVQSIVDFYIGYMEKWINDVEAEKGELEVKNLQIKIRNVSQKIQNLQSEQSSLPGNSDAANSQRQYTSATELINQQEIYSQLNVELELLETRILIERSRVYKVLEMAEVPDQKSGPSRGTLCIIVVFSAFFFSVFLAFVINAVENIKKDPEAMAKLRGTKEEKT